MDLNSRIGAGTKEKKRINEIIIYSYFITAYLDAYPIESNTKREGDLARHFGFTTYGDYRNVHVLKGMNN